jgi:hypothetical protein
MDGHDQPPTSLKSRGPYVVLLLGALTLIAGAAALFWYSRQQGALPPPAPDAGVAVVPDAGAPEAVDLAEGDALAKQTLADLVPKAWLEGADPIRRAAAAVNAIAEGQSPRPVLAALAPGGTFTVDEERPKTKKRKQHLKSKFFISPKNDARYDAVTAAFTKVDAAAVGRLYGKFRPYLEAAYREIARPGKTFDGAFTAAVDRLAAVPITDGPREVVPMPQGTDFAWADPKLEALSPAEKHLLRMGPKNARAVVQQLKAFRAAMSAPQP